MLCAKNGDRDALWREMSRAIYAVARPGHRWDGPSLMAPHAATDQ